LYFGYLKNIRAQVLSQRKKPLPEIQPEWAEIRFPLIAEFSSDYQKFLSDVQGRLLSHFGDGRTQKILPNFFCFRAEKGADAILILESFFNAARHYFPALLSDGPCPVRVSVAVCGVKYPFFEVWRQWEAQQAEVEITAVGHGRLELETKQLEKFLRLTEFSFRRTALHNLAEISRVSQELAELRFRAKGEKGERETFDHLTQFLPLGLTFDGILTLAKLLGT
jgi:hypothetical protein